MPRGVFVALLAAVAVMLSAQAFASSSADSTVAPPTEQVAPPAEQAPPPADQAAPPPPAPPDSTPPPPKVAPAPAVPAQPKPPEVFFQKAVVVIDGKAEANGSLRMEFHAQGAEPVSFSVNVLAKSKKSDVARDIHKELSIAVGSAFKVKLEGEKVKIEQTDKKKSPTFSITVAELAVTGLSVRVAKG